MQASPLNGGAIPNWGAQTLMGFDERNVQEGVRVKGSNRQHVHFYKKKIVMPIATEVEKRELPFGVVQTTVKKTGFKEVELECVRIITPGDKNVLDDVASDFHRREHWLHYKNFRDGKGVPLGTPIDDVTFISQGIATELKYLGVHTLEQFADAADILCNQIPSGWELREFARAQCKANEQNQSLTQVNVLRAELEKSQAVVANMQRQMDELKGMLLDAKGNPVNYTAPTEGAPAKPEGIAGVQRTSPARNGGR